MDELPPEIGSHLHNELARRCYREGRAAADLGRPGRPRLVSEATQRAWIAAQVPKEDENEPEDLCSHCWALNPIEATVMSAIAIEVDGEEILDRVFFVLDEQGVLPPPAKTN
jgi:hypothetical protein